MFAIAEIAALEIVAREIGHSAPHEICLEHGAQLVVEITIEAVRHYAGATVVKTPFFNPPRKTATPPP